jgi:hypothetical protein
VNRYANERGSGLVLIIGVVAALAIMATTAVTLMANVQHNTSSETTRTKAFNVTEAALDVGMYQLNNTFPANSPSEGFVWGTTAQSAFSAQFTSVVADGKPQYRNVTSAVTYYDNPPYTSPYSASSPPLFDANKDNKLYLVAQAGVMSQKARVQALVQRTFANMGLPTGVALFTGADLYSNGGGNNPKIVIDPGQGPQGSEPKCEIRVVGTIDDTTVYDQSQYSAAKTGAAAGSADDIVSPTLIESLTALAKTHGRYFSGANAIASAENSPANGQWSDGGCTGLTVISSPYGTTLSLKDDYNSQDRPGILLLLGGANFDFGGGGNFWGVMYTEGTVDKGHGNFIIHGMLVAKDTTDMRGTVNIAYNRACIVNLNARFPSNVRIVPNTWRELKPIAPL